MFLAPSRFLFLLLFLMGALLLAASVYLERSVGIDPCSLGRLQRYLLYGICLITLIAFVQGPERLSRLIFCASVFLISLLGAFAAGRQVLMLDEAGTSARLTCGPGLDYMLENFSLFEALRLAFKGSSECVRITWTLFDMSIPEWSLLVFALMSVFALYCFSHFIRPSLAGDRARGDGRAD